MIFASYWGSLLGQFSKFKNFIWVCWFLCKILSNFVSLPWKLHNPYCHIAHPSISTSLDLLFFNFESIETTCSTLKLWDTLLFLSAFKMHPPPCDLVFVKLKIFGWGAFLLHLLHLVTVTFAKKSLLGKQNYLTKISLAQTIA